MAEPLNSVIYLKPESADNYGRARNLVHKEKEREPTLVHSSQPVETKVISDWAPT
jgi:hypothetical protein